MLMAMGGRNKKGMLDFSFSLNWSVINCDLLEVQIVQNGAESNWKKKNIYYISFRI